MKIGPIDISYRMLTYAGIIAVEVVALLSLWSSNSEIRAESIYRNRVQRGLYDSDIEGVAQAIEAATQVVQFSPRRVDARLYLGSLQYRQKDFKAAQQTFDDTAAMPHATAQQKVWALCGSAAALYSAAPEEGAAKAAVEAEKLFKAAAEIKLDGGKTSADALAGLATLSFLKGPTFHSDAMKFSEQALAAVEPPSLKILAQLYNVRGVIQNQTGRAQEATTSFAQAQFLRPDSADFIENRRLSRLTAVFDKSLSDQQKIDLLQKINYDFANYGRHQALASTVMGIGHGSMKSHKDFMKGPYNQSMAAFQRAIALDPADMRPFRSKSQLLEERIAEVVKTMVSPVSGLNGETPTLSIWGNGPKHRFAPQDGNAISEIRTLLTEQETVWTTVADRSAGAEKIEARLRQLSAVRRLFWTTVENDAPTRKALLDKMLKFGNETITLDAKSGIAHFTLGLIHIDRGDFGQALSSMKAAKDNGWAAPDLDAMIEGLSMKPELLDIRPSGRRRWFGATPLISGSLRTPTVGYKAVKMQIDGKEVQPVVIGTQVLFVPDESFNLDGDHNVKVTVVDKFDNATEFPPFEFGLDKKAPAIKVQPDSGATVGSKPAWTITLGDASGVDGSATLVVFKTVKAPQMITRELVKAGKFKIGFPDAKPPMRAGALAGDSFTVTPGQELQPGEYSLVVTSSDLNGNVSTETKTYTVK